MKNILKPIGGTFVGLLPIILIIALVATSVYVHEKLGNLYLICGLGGIISGLFFVGLYEKNNEEALARWAARVFLLITLVCVVWLGVDIILSLKLDIV